jgi:HYR domain/Ricin-type beta-trefoil lectin domain-like/Secretion system C-terminal sorting domain
MTKPQLLYYSVLLTGFFAFFSTPIFGQSTACVGDTTAPIFERCPQNMVINQSVQAGTTQNCAFVQWETPLAYDNCGIASMNRTWTSGECFPIGSTTVTYTAIDSSHNSAACTFTVTVLEPNIESCVHDSISPILSRCPENIFLTTDDTCAIAIWNEPIATDNCSVPSVFGTFQSGMCFPLGYTTVAYTAIDSAQNSSSCSFVVIVSNPCAMDTIKPVFANCPNNIVLSTSGTTCASAQWTAPRASDNCGIASTFATAQPGRCFSIGITTVTYRATDLRGNVGICTFTVNVSSPCAVDTIKPVISACPTNIVLGTYDTCAVAAWVAPTATDNCSIAAIFPTIQSGSCFPIGTTIVSYLARDAKNNTSGCEFTVTVNHLCQDDIIKPTFTSCPTNIVLATTDTCARAQWALPTITDNCGTPTLTSTHNPGSCFNLGLTNVTYTATDTRNNKSTCSFLVTVTNNSPCVNDTVKPILTNCPYNITLLTSTNCAVARWAAPRITDNCGTPTLTSTRQSGDCFSVGDTNVVYTGRDTKNNTATCSFRVRVYYFNPCATDTIKPVLLNCPSNIVLTSVDSCAYAQWQAPTAFDFCGATTVTSTHTPSRCFTVGTTTVTYTATDASNNKSQCSFTVTVGASRITACDADTIKPTFVTCPTNIVLTTLDTCAIAQWTIPIATDNCGTPSVVSTHNSGRCFPIGTTTVGYAATDAKSNRTYCSFTVTVNRLNATCAIDTIKPVLTRCPTNIAMVSIDSCSIANWTAPTATDNCGTPTVSSTKAPNSCFGFGTTTVTYSAKDSKNNTSTCAFTVTITRPCANDTIKPRFPFCPTNIVLTSSDTCARATWVMPVATDNCSEASVTGTHDLNSCFKTGINTVVYTAKDANNNTGICSFTVTVTNPCATDTTKPRIANCPVNIVLNTTDSCAIAQWATPTVTDNCGTPTLVSTHRAGRCFPTGTTPVTYTARDSRGNTTLCTFTVAVNNPCFRDSIKPIIVNCPANITINTADTCSIARWTAPTATDNCGTPTLTASHQSGACFRMGTTTVSYFAKDAKNNSALCAFAVIVINPCFSDTIKPVIKNCPANISLSSADSCSIARWIAPTATDNCSTPTLAASYESGLCFRVGSTTVTYTARDAKNNTATCTFKVTVSNPCFTDTIKPTIYNCPASVTKTIADTAVAITWKIPSALDNCGNATLTTTKQPNSLFGVGTTTVVYTASDSKNNINTCSFTVTIKRTITACSNDTVKPVFNSCPTNITVTTTSPNAIAQWTTPTATDNCTAPSVSGTFVTGASFPTGTTAVVFTATDAKGNFSKCNFSVTVVTNRTSLVLDSTKCYALIARSSKKAMSIANASTVAGAYGVQWAYLNSLNQKWKISPTDSNSFNFTNKLSNLNLDTRWGSLVNNERLTQWGRSATAATQKWQLTLLADGYYRVTNKGSGRALSVSGGATATSDGSLLIQSTYTGLTSQQWSISEVPCTSNTIAFVSNDMIEMQANPEFNRARIEWSDNTGYKNDYYEIQKLNQTSGEFERLDVVANKSLSNAPSYQTFYDNSPMDGDNFYRVKVVYLDSVSKLSAVKKLVFNGLETVKLFPNPANDYVDIDLTKFGNEAINIYLYNGFGKQVAFRSVQKDKFSVVHFDISQQEMGNYLMRISAKGKKDVMRQLQIVR